MSTALTQELFAAALFAALLRASAPVILAALGGLVSELCGVINVGLEGLMLVGAFFGVIGSAYAPGWFPGAAPWVYAAVGCALGLAAAVALALTLAVFHLEFGADLIVAGIGINMLAAGLTVFLMVWLTGDKGSTASLASATLPSLHVPGLARWPVLDIALNGEGRGGHHVLVYAAFLAAPLLWLLLFRSRLGLRLRAIGENREAALAAGIAVKRLQYVALGLSGALAGLGGLYLSMGYLTLFQADMAAGRGFLALAAVFLGGRRPLGTLAAAVLFGASSVLAAQLGAFDLPSQVVYMVLPLCTIVALVAFHQRRALLRARRLRQALADYNSAGTVPASHGASEA
jgi:ABC-type uncharacterized transport system permease subunit